ARPLRARRSRLSGAQERDDQPGDLRRGGAVGGHPDHDRALRPGRAGDRGDRSRGGLSPRRHARYQAGGVGMNRRTLPTVIMRSDDALREARPEAEPQTARPTYLDEVPGVPRGPARMDNPGQNTAPEAASTRIAGAVSSARNDPARRRAQALRIV